MEQDKDQIRRRLTAIQDRTGSAVAGSKASVARMDEEIKRLQGLRNGTDRTIVRLERDLAAVAILNLILLEWPEETEEAVQQLRSSQERLMSDSITMAEHRDLSQEALNAERQLQRSCPHVFVLHHAGSKSYSSYEDPTSARRQCLTCGLEENGRTVEGDFTALASGPRRVALHGYPGHRIRETIPGRQLRKSQILQIVLADAAVRRIYDELTDSLPPTVRNA